MIPKIHKLFNDQSDLDSETIETLATGDKFQLEHIISRGDKSAADTWYDQETDEWVALIAGSATLEFEEGSVNLFAGDSLTIPRHLKHRVSETSTDAVWIALHYKKDSLSS